MNESSCPPHPRQRLVLPVFWILAILTGVQWHLPPSPFLKMLPVQAGPQHLLQEVSLFTPPGEFHFYMPPRMLVQAFLPLATRCELRLLFYERRS